MPKRKSRRKVKYEKGVPAKYLKNKKNSKSQVAAEIRRTAKAYKQGKYINVPVNGPFKADEYRY